MTANDSKINLPSGSMVDGLTISTSDVDSGVAINRIAIGANASATVDNTAVIGDSSVAQVFAGKWQCFSRGCNWCSNTNHYTCLCWTNVY